MMMESKEQEEEKKGELSVADTVTVTVKSTEQEEEKKGELSDDESINASNEAVPLKIQPEDTPQPQSLVATQEDHSKRDKLLSQCFNKLYDILTIFISIADVVTDILVLISFYKSNHMTFFWISVAILTAAQIGYIIVFFICFEVDDFAQNLSDAIEKCCCCKCCKCCDKYCDKCCKWKIWHYIGNCFNKCCKSNFNPCKHIVLGCDRCLSTTYGECMLVTFLSILAAILLLAAFCCLLPFGHLVSFLMYFAEDEDSKFFKCLSNKIGIEKRSNIPLEESWSEMAQFTVEKINKHGGFILEAFLEALPQSILQLIAMVYFKQTNYIAVGSIILSMTSIMTKSLVISQGLEWKSYVFTWLCVCSDFFYIFFVVSWIFLSNDYVYGDFIGHFSVIGQYWWWKVAVSVIPPIAFVAIAYFAVGIWFIIAAIWMEFDDLAIWRRIGLIFLYLTLGNAVLITAYCIAAFIGCLVLEITCFSYLAGFIWMFFTVDRWDYTEKKVANILKTLLHFISNASYKNNDTIIRILCINYAHSTDGKLSKYILERKKNETLHDISYQNIRNNCSKPKHANLFSEGIKEYFGICKQFVEIFDDFDGCGLISFEDSYLLLLYIGGLLLLYISLPIYLLSRICSILYPYFIVAYLSYYNLWDKMHVFELSMLAFYILLQVSMFILGIFVFRTHLWLWHIAPGFTSYDMNWSSDHNKFLKKMYGFYDSIQWLPVAKQIVFNRFGKDIGLIIVAYLKE